MSTGTDALAIQSFFILVLLVGWMTAWLRKRTGWLLAIGMGYLCFSALRIFANPYSPYANEPEAWVNALDSVSARSLALGMIIMLSSAVIPSAVLIRGFQNVAILNAVTIFLTAMVAREPMGILFNASMSGCFAAATLPLFFVRRPYPWHWIALVASSVLVAGQSMPFGVLVFLGCVWMIQRRRFNELALLAVAAACLGFALMGDQLLSSNSRFTAWRVAMSWWQDHANPWLGSGSGTFVSIGPDLTNGRHPDAFPAKWMWLHSDWLQILFEQGILGLCLATAVFVTALRRFYHAQNQAGFYALIACGAFAAANMPLRYPLTALLCAFLVVWAFAEKQKA